MNKYYSLTYLIALSVILIAKSAIAKPGQSSIALANSSKLCDPVLEESLSLTQQLENQTKGEKNFNNISHKYFSPTLSQASIWWAAQQFDPFEGNLIENWLTYPEQQQINLTVNWQLWTLLDYFGRYRFVNQFGTVVRKYGYSLNIFNQKNQCLATYSYNSSNNPPKWELYLKKLGKDSLQVEPQRLPTPEDKI